VRRHLLLCAVVGCAPVIDAGPIPAVRAAAPVRTLTLPATDGEVVYLAAMVAAGSARDPVGHEGIAALTARALADAGAGDRDARAVRDALYTVGTELTVHADRDWVSLRMSCPALAVTACVDLFADALVVPRFDSADVTRLRDDAVYAVTTGLLTDEEALAHAAFEGLLFEGHPYGNPVRGRGGALAALDPDDARAFHRTQYVRESVLVGLAGAWTADAKLHLETRLQSLPTDRHPDVPVRTPPAVTGRSLLGIDTETPVTGFVLGHPIAVDRAHPDYAAMWVATTALGSHRQTFGRLFRALRTDRGLNYGDYAYIEPHGALPQHHPRFQMWIRPTSVENGPFALKLAVLELERWASAGLDEEELEATRAWLSRTLPLAVRDPDRQLAQALRAAASGVDLSVAAQRSALGAVTLSSVNAALATHIRPDDLLMVAVSGEADALVAALTEDAATPIVYSDVTPDAAAAERDEVVSQSDVQLQEAWTRPAQGVFR